MESYSLWSLLGSRSLMVMSRSSFSGVSKQERSAFISMGTLR